jgi:hypothetical protein
MRAVATRSAGAIFWWLSLLRVLARERVAPPEQSPRVMEASVGPHGIATRAKTRTRTYSTATTDTTPHHRGLNKGEARNALAQAGFLNRKGEIRDRTAEPALELRESPRTVHARSRHLRRQIGHSSAYFS